MSLAVDADPLKTAIGAVDEPLILVTTVFLAVEADELNAVISAVEANKPRAVDAEPLKVATDELIV